MSVQIIINQQKGPLPITVSFKPVTDGPCCLVVTGSVWTQNVNSTIGIEISLDKKPIGSASIWSNAVATHRAVVPKYIPVKLTFDQHELTLTTTAGTISDINDFFNVVLEY